MLLQNIYQLSATIRLSSYSYFILSSIGIDKYWTGGNDLAVQGVYRWAGVDTLLIPTATNWGWSHEGANSATDRCVAIVHLLVPLTTSGLIWFARGQLDSSVSSYELFIHK